MRESEKISPGWQNNAEKLLLPMATYSKEDSVPCSEITSKLFGNKIVVSFATLLFSLHC